MSNLKTNKNSLKDTLQILTEKGYIPKLQEKIIIPSNNSQTITADEGYDGISHIVIDNDRDFISENIKDGITIFGTEGKYEDRDYSIENRFIEKTIDEYRNDRIEEIGSEVFSNSYSLISVDFPECTKITAQYAFGNCTSLKIVDFPKCTFFEEGIFANCTSLREVSFPVCSAISYELFNNCSSLREVSFPECSIIDGYAFSSCDLLTNIDFPKCSYIGDDAFRYCTSLTSVDFPNCTHIGESAFYNCTSLTFVDFPACTNIGGSAFNNCTSLTSVSFPNCTTISSYAFSYCTSLTSVSFPACTSIGDLAFRQCISLASVDFPKCSYIGRYAFESCTSLTSVVLRCPSVAILSNANAFTSTPMSISTLTGSFGSIYVPASLVDAYKTATNWATYADRITAIPGSAVLINFTINGVSYQAEEDMTWDSWVNSSYNTGGFLANEETDSITNSKGYEVLYNSTAFSPSTTIISETAYTLASSPVPT